MRQFQFRVGHENFALIHVSLVPVINGEEKSKPTQAAIRDLRGLGLAPDLIACRCSQPLEPALIDKLTMFCHVGPGQVIGVHDVSSTYHVPLLLRQQNIIEYFTKRLALDTISVSARGKAQGELRWEKWKNLTVSYTYFKVLLKTVMIDCMTAFQLH
jgi:CTP synthase